MATLYTDLALRQSIGGNFIGSPGLQQITDLPTNTGQTRALYELPEILATYTIVNTEAAGDTINIGKLEQGYIVDPNGKISSGVTAPGTTLTVAVGDNDLGQPSSLPVVNPQALANPQPDVTGVTAPLWVSGTTYVLGNVVRDDSATSAPHVQYDTYTCVTATTSASTAPSSAATTVWMPNRQRYSGSINIAGASSNVAFAAGTQMYGGPASLLPYSVTPGQVALGLTTNEKACQQYQIQNDCWLQARILTASTLTAGTTLTFRVPLVLAN